jgi:DNA-binding FrmR family transcriptional regulator
MSEQNTPHTHKDQEAVLNRLARIEGHVHGIKRMVEEDTPCPDVLVQIAAVRSALNSVGQIILEDHLRNCMVRAVHDGNFEDAMRDLKISLNRFIG